MAIKKLTKTGILIECSNCEKEREIQYSEIEAGIKEEDRSISTILRIPPCPCGCISFMQMNLGQHPSSSSFSGRHRAAVNRLFLVLEDLGRTVEGYERTETPRNLLDDPLKVGEVEVNSLPSQEKQFPISP